MAVSHAKLASSVECKICLDSFHIPKQLTCGHSYCKECLDNVLKFNKDGSAVLPCPMKCETRIIIPKDGTTKSLATNYGLTDILDLVNEPQNRSHTEEKKNDSCQESKQCKRSIRWSCSVCSVKICTACQKEHLCKDALFTFVIYNEKSGEIQPMCAKHDSLANHVCVTCENEFICVYCIHREHKNHRDKSVVDFGLEAKNWFQSFITSFVETKDIPEGLSIKYMDVLSSLNAKRDELVNEINVRKLKRLEQYLIFLNDEGERMVKTFDEKVEEFRSKVVTAGFDVTDNLCTKIKEFSEYLDKFQVKSNFELVFEKIEIERQFRNLTSLPSEIPYFHLQLDEIDYDVYTKSALGQMKISVEDKKTTATDIRNISVEKTCITKTNEPVNHEILNDGLDYLIDIVKEYNDNSINSKQSETVEAKLKGNEQPEMIELEKQPIVKINYTFKDLRQLIKNNDVDALKVILAGDASIVKMRNTKQSTLLTTAVWHGKKDIVKVLIDYGSDLWAENMYGWNVYHHSCFCNHREILKLLISHDGTNINHVNEESRTPLHLASLKGYIECVKLLLSVPQIDVNIRDRDNHTASDCAKVGKIKKLIVAHGKK